MSSFSISIDGVDKLSAKLGRIERVQDVLEPVARRRIRAMRDRARIYPPRLPNQRYVRTYTLRGGWNDSVQRVSNGIVARAENKVGYSPWVQGYGTQAGIHRGRWETERQILDAETPQTVQEFGDAIQRALDE